MEGGLGPGGTSSYMLSALTEASEALGLDLTMPFEDLPKKMRTALIYGNAQFAGILKTLEEHYSQASEGYREWLMEFMSPTTCPACHGARLKPASLAVSVQGVSIAEFTSMAMARALPLVKKWKFGERELKIVGARD